METGAASCTDPAGILEEEPCTHIGVDLGVEGKVVEGLGEEGLEVGLRVGKFFRGFEGGKSFRGFEVGNRYRL